MNDPIGSTQQIAYTHNESDKAFAFIERNENVKPNQVTDGKPKPKPEYPEPRNPKSQLQTELVNYRRVEREISEHEKLALEAEEEAKRIPVDEGLSESESIAAIAQVQAKKLHHEGRLAARKRALGTAIISLGREVAAGESWLRYQFLKLTDERRSQHLEKLKSLFGLRAEDITRSPKVVYDFLSVLPSFREVQGIAPNQGLAADQSMLLARSDDCLAKIFRAESLLKKGGE